MPRKRSSGDGGLYLDRGTGLWQATYTFEGKAYRRRSKTQAGARAKLDELKAQLAATGSPLGNQTVEQWGGRWLEEGKTRWKPTTWRARQSILKVWIMPTIGRKNVKDVRPSDLQRIYGKMRDAGRSGASATKAHTIMSAMFEGARLEQLVSTNVAQNTKPPRAGKTARGAFTPDETLRLLEAARHVRHGSKWIVSLYAGLRQGERLGATVDSVDLERGLFTVHWNLVEGNYEHGCGGTCGKTAAGWCPDRRLVVPDIEVRLLGGRMMLVPPKSGEPRTFPLPIALGEILADHIATLEDPDGLLWPTDDGRSMRAHTDADEWDELLAAAGVDRPGATTHWARHTAISDLTAAGVPDRTIGEMVGHKSAGVTGHYQHLSSQDAQDAMRALEARRSAR